MSVDDPAATAPLEAATGPAPEDGSARAGALIGRYLKLDRLGRGGGGEVFSAFDPVLDRKVAIKLLHGSHETKPALIREGRMLAKVSHPNVVEVYEVGFHEDQPYMAMELASGGDLGRFAKTQRASGDVASIMSALLEVCEGVIAAHDAGIVHGDIKPANVLRSDGGVFKVSDFGIAQLQSVDAADAAGRPAGTSAFMAPEQHAGAKVDERCDQYAFCVTAWLVLTGSLPFSRDNASVSTEGVSPSATGPLDDIETYKREGPPAWPGVRGVSGSVADALRRGLSPAPAERWPSMLALAEQLRPNLAKARLQRVGASLLGVGVVAAGVLGYAEYEERRAAARCRDAGRALHETWNEESAATVRDALTSTGSSYGESTADRVVPRLDAWEERWAAVRTQTCLAHAVEETWDEDTAARADWCLQERKLDFDAVVQRLAAPEAEALNGAVAMTASLPSPDVCADAFSLARRPAPPQGSEREDQQAFRAALARAEALDSTGSYAEGLEAIEAAKTSLADADSPLLAAALVTEGNLHAHAGAYAESEAASLRAYSLAAQNEDWTTAALAAESLIFVLGAKLDRPAEGAAWATHAEIAAALGGDPLRLHEAGRTSNLAVVERALGHYDEAIALHERALDAGSESLGADHPERASTMGNLGAVYMEKGEVDAALELFEEAAELRKRALGALHPSSLSSLSNFAAGLAKSGQLARSKQIFETVLERREQALGPEHPDVAQVLDNTAAVSNMLGDSKSAEALLQRSLAIKTKTVPGTMAEAETLSHLATAKSANGDTEAAVELLERCLEIREKVRGPEHASVGEALINLGTEYFILGDLERAEAMFGRAKTIYAEALGTSHFGYGAALNNLGDVALESGRYAEAVELYEQSYAIWKDSLGPNHPHTATALAHAGDAWLRDGRPSKARPLLEQAIAAFEAGEGTQEQEATTRFDLAQLLEAAGEHEEATASAKEARAVLVEIGGGRMLHPADIDAWLEAR
ncbi:MAG: tetratricopeptide repeat protein [Nannocystaceae bacterium]|nr:serine/threonine-protein kinase [bacterium]